MKDAEQPKFIHLRCHSEYSVTDGIVKIRRVPQPSTRSRYASIGLNRFE